MTRTKRLAAGVQVLLGIVYLAAGLPKLWGTEVAAEQFEEYGFPGWFARVAGFLETLGGAGLFLGLRRPAATVVAGVVLVPTMVIGALVHRRHPDDHDALAVPPGVLATLLGGVMLRSAWAVRRDRKTDDTATENAETEDADGTPRVKAAEPPGPEAAYRVVNPLVERVLRSPLHRFVGDSLALITFTGRKSGAEFTTPVGYHALGDEGTIVVFTHSDWWRNLRGGQPVTLRLRGTDRRAIAEPTQDDDQVAEYVEAFVARNGVENARRIGLDIENGGLPAHEELKQGLKDTVVIEIELLD